MLQLLYDFYLSFPLAENLSAILAFTSILSIAFLLGYIGHKIFSKFLLKHFYAALIAQNAKIAEIIASERIPRKILCFLIPTVILAFLQNDLSKDVYPLIVPMTLFVDKIVAIYIIILLGILVDSLLETGRKIYILYPISVHWPIRTYVQFLKVFSFIIFAVFVVCKLIDQSPIAFFTGLGAAMALIMLVFKDSILSFVASLQISASQILRVGDLVEIPDKKISGYVLEMSLNAIKIQNFDKSIATVPPYYIISNTITNWRGMFESGARRIKRAIYIETTSVVFATDALLKELNAVALLQEHMAFQPPALDSTNLGLFRQYIELYLAKNEVFHTQNLPFMARILEQTEAGALPLEIYTFTKETQTKDYDLVQSALIEHIIAMMPLFKLTLHQQH